MASQQECPTTARERKSGRSGDDQWYIAAIEREAARSVEKQTTINASSYGACIALSSSSRPSLSNCVRGSECPFALSANDCVHWIDGWNYLHLECGGMCA